MDKQNNTSARGVETMKTQNEIEELKRNWKSDPCWDIEETEGFEEHKEELKQFRLDQEKEWEARRYNSLLLRSEALGIRGNIKLVNCIELLESRIKSLEERLYSLENITDVEREKRR